MTFQIFKYFAMICVVISVSCDKSVDPSPQVYQLLFVGQVNQVYGQWLYTVSSDGTGLRRITPDSIEFYSQYSLSPNGTTVAFKGKRFMKENFDIWTVDISTQRIARLNDAPAWDDFPLWILGGTGVAFRSDRSGRPSLWACGIDGTNVRQLIPDSLTVEYRVSASSDGNRLAFFANKGLWILDLAPYQLRQVLPDSFLQATNSDVALSPDGSQVAFLGNPSQFNRLYIYSIANSTFQLCSNAPRIWTPIWSPDSRHLSFSTWDALFTVDLSTNSQMLLTQYSNYNPSNIAWSFDGKFIAYDRFPDAGLFIVSSTGGPARKVPIEIVSPYYPQWLPMQ